jgi:hypothetical protein
VLCNCAAFVGILKILYTVLWHVLYPSFYILWQQHLSPFLPLWHPMDKTEVNQEQLWILWWSKKCYWTCWKLNPNYLNVQFIVHHSLIIDYILFYTKDIFIKFPEYYDRRYINKTKVQNFSCETNFFRLINDTQWRYSLLCWTAVQFTVMFHDLLLQFFFLATQIVQFVPV